MKHRLLFSLLALVVPAYGAFEAQTLVQTQEKVIPLAQVEKGAVVSSVSLVTFEPRNDQVIGTYQRKIHTAIRFVLGSETITKSAEQLLYCVDDSDFKSAEKFRAGEHLMNVEGDLILIQEIMHQLM